MPFVNANFRVSRSGIVVVQILSSTEKGSSMKTFRKFLPALCFSPLIAPPDRQPAGFTTSQRRRRRRIIGQPMNGNRSLLMASVLVFATPALAQQHRSAGVRPSGGGVHPGQQQPHHMMSPEEQMMHEFYLQQMWLGEMMRSRQGTRGHVQGQSASGNGQSGSNRQYQTRQPKQAKRARAVTPDHEQPQNHQPGDNKGKQDAANSKSMVANRTKERAKAKLNETKGVTANRSSRADIGTILLLKNVHSKLHRADADYLGHRVRAMNHIATAIHHLGSTIAFIARDGMGTHRLPQAESDQILHDAVFQLNHVQASLGTGTTAAARHRDVHANVTEAIHELQISLRLR